jgi:peptidoglycan hydrolase CwlO-like protein
MDNSTIIAVVTAIASALGGIVFGKKHEKAKTKKTDAEADSITVSTTEKAVAIWEQLNGQLHNELGQLRIQIDNLRKENGNLHKENIELKKQIASLTYEVENLKEILKER